MRFNGIMGNVKIGYRKESQVASFSLEFKVDPKNLKTVQELLLCQRDPVAVEIHKQQQEIPGLNPPLRSKKSGPAPGSE